MKNIYLQIVYFLVFSLTVFPQWTQVGGTLSGLGQAPRICVVDSNVVWVAGGLGTSPVIYRTLDGGQHWASIPTTGLPYFILGLAAKDSVTAFVADVGSAVGTGGNAKLFKTTDAGLNWTIIDSTGGSLGFYNDIQFSKSNPQFGIAMSDPANGLGGPFIVNKTTDGGVTWVKTNPPGVPNSYGLFYTAYAIDPQFYGFAVWDNATKMTSYTTTDGGNNWFLGDSTIQVINWGDIVFNDDKQHGIMLGNEWPNIKITSNGGNNWVTVNTGTDISNISAATWVSNTDVVFVSAIISPTNKRIIRSDDNGLTWEQQDAPSLAIREIDNVRHGNAMYGYGIAMDGSVIKSIQAVTVIPVELSSFTASINKAGNILLKWTTATETNNQGFYIQRKLGDEDWARIAFLAGHGTTTEPQQYSYVDDIGSITSNSFAYRLKQIDFDGSFEYSDVVYVDNFIPTEFVLHQNFPNPFNPVTTIEYSLPVKSQIELEVFNSLGEQVAILESELKDAGKYTIEFDARKFPSGIYFYSIQAGDFVETKKMVFMK